MNSSTPAEGNNSGFSATVRSVKSLRYSNETILDFFEIRDNTGSQGIRNTAVSYTGKEIGLNPGDELKILSKPRKIDITDNRISSFETSLLRKGIHYIFYLNERNIKVTKKKPDSLKAGVRNAIEDNQWKLFNKKTVPVLKALYFGNKSYIDKSTITDFKRAGVLHILAASGLHIGIIAGTLFILLAPFLINKKIIVLIISLALFFYLYITDMPVSLLRAFIMYCIYCVQYIFDLNKNILNTLFISAVIILILYPFELYSAGFQLSFGATFGIIVFFKFYNEILSFLPGKISKTISATLSAQVFVLPVIYAHMKEINLTNIISNLIMLFTMSFTLISSLIANLLSIFSLYAAKYIAAITDILYGISLFIIKHLSKINGHFIIGDRDYRLLLPYILFILPVLPLIKNKKIRSLIMFISIILAWGLLSDKYSPAEKEITILRKNKASIILLKGYNENILFGKLQDMETAGMLAEYISKNNMKNINICIPTPDYQNLRSYLYLIKNTIVSDCYISSDFRFTSYLRKFCQILDIDRIKLHIIKFDDQEANKYADSDPEDIADIFESPLKNINKIYYLLVKNQDENYFVIENIADEYKINYLE